MNVHLNFLTENLVSKKNRIKLPKIFNFFCSKAFYWLIIIGYFHYESASGHALAQPAIQKVPIRPYGDLISENNPREAQKIKVTKKKKYRKKAPNLKKSTEEWQIGFGLSGGFEAPFGNGAVISAKYQKNFLAQIGVGYNLSGLKIGAGCDYLWALNKYFSFPFGLAIVRSNGISGSVSIDGTFTSETGDSEAIQAKRRFALSPAFYFSPKAGITVKLFDNTDIYFLTNYNVIVGGNKVTFTNDISYDQDIAVINEAEAKSQFEKKAAEKVRTGGFGGQIGFNFWF